VQQIIATACRSKTQARITGSNENAQQPHKQTQRHISKKKSAITVTIPQTINHLRVFPYQSSHFQRERHSTVQKFVQATQEAAFLGHHHQTPPSNHRQEQSSLEQRFINDNNKANISNSIFILHHITSHHTITAQHIAKPASNQRKHQAKQASAKQTILVRSCHLQTKSTKKIGRESEQHRAKYQRAITPLRHNPTTTTSTHIPVPGFLRVCFRLYRY